MRKNLSIAQKATFYKFEPDTNLKECEKLSGTQFDVFDREIKKHRSRATKTMGLSLSSEQQIRMNKILDRKFVKEQSCDLLDYDLS